MTATKLDNDIAAARAYDALFVPALFGQWATIVADAARVAPGDRVLDVACGTGVLTRAIQKRIGMTGRITGLDCNAGMLTVAEELSPGVAWQQGVAESMPFADASFDVVVCQFGLMLMDPVAAIREMLRVVVPKGRLVATVFDRVENIPPYAAEIDLLERRSGRAASDALRIPFSLGDKTALSEAFEAAGAQSSVIRTVKGIARFPDARTMVESDLRGWLPLMGVALSEEEVARILDEAQEALAPHVTHDDGIAFVLPAHIVTAQAA